MERPELDQHGIRRAPSHDASLAIRRRQATFWSAAAGLPLSEASAQPMRVAAVRAAALQSGSLAAALRNAADAAVTLTKDGGSRREDARADNLAGVRVRACRSRPEVIRRRA